MFPGQRAWCQVSICPGLSTRIFKLNLIDGYLYAVSIAFAFLCMLFDEMYKAPPGRAPSSYLCRLSGVLNCSRYFFMFFDEIYTAFPQGGLSAPGSLPLQ